MAENFYSSNNSNKNLKKVISVLWILLAVVVICAIVFSVMFVKNLETENNLYAATAEEQYLNANVLICITDTENKEVKPKFTLIGFNGKSKNILLTQLPYTLKLQAAEQTDTALNLFKYGGGTYLKSAIENNYGIQVDKYITADLSEVEQFVDKLGGVDFNIENKMQQVNSEGSLITNLVAGNQHLNGNQYCQFLRYDGWKDDQDKATHCNNLLKTLINSNNKLLDTEEILSIYEAVSEKLDTDISIIEMNDFALKFRVYKEIENPAAETDIDFNNDDISSVKIDKYYKK